MPASSRIWIGEYDFDLADINTPHTVAEVPMGAGGPLAFTMQDWSGGQQSVEEGIEYRRLPKYISSKGADAAFSGQVICQPSATTISVGSGPVLETPTKQIDFVPSGGTINTYLMGGRRVHRLINPGTTNTWTTSLDGAPTLMDIVAHGQKLAVGIGSGGLMYSTTGVVSSYTTATVNKADAFGVLGQNLYRAQRPNTIYAATAIDGTWDSGSSIGDTSFNINSLGGIEQVLMIGKEDGVYSLDNDGTVVPFTPELRTQANSNFASLRAADSFNGDYYFRTLNGVIEITGADGTKERVGLDQLSTPDLPTVVVQALTHDDRYLYALCANATGTDLAILRRSIRGAWHTLYYVAGAGEGKHLAISSALGYPALFFTYDSGGGTIVSKFIRLSTFPNPLQDTNYRYDTAAAGRIRMGRYGSAEAQTVWDQMTIQSRSCTANITITPYLSADGGAITQFGSAAVTSNPFTTIRPTTPVTANFVDVYFDLTTNSASSTPVLVGFSLKGLRRPNHRKVHTFTLTTERGHTDIRGGQRREGPTEAAADLRTLLNTNTYQTVKDERGNSFSGLVDQLNRTTIKPKAGAEPQEAIQVVIAELS